MGEHPVLVHLDPSGACAVSRLDPVRGAADRTAPVDGTEPDALTAGPDVVAAMSASTVRLWDAELRAVEAPDGGHLPGPVRALHASAHGVWIVFEAGDGALCLRTIVVPDAASDAGATARDVTIVGTPAGDSASAGGAPGLVTAAHGERLLVAVRVRGAAGSEQQVFVAAADGRLRKLTTRPAGAVAARLAADAARIASSSRAVSTATARAHRPPRGSATARGSSSTPPRARPRC